MHSFNCALCISMNRSALLPGNWHSQEVKAHRKPEGFDQVIHGTETLTNLLVKCHNNMDLAKVYKQQTVLPGEVVA